MMNRNTGISYDGRRDSTNVNIGQLSSQTNGLPQAAGDALQRTGQRLKSQDPEAASIAHDCGPDQDRTPSQARHAPAHRGPFWAVFPRQGRFSPRHAPPRQLHFSHPDRNQPLSQSVYWNRPVGG